MGVGAFKAKIGGTIDRTDTCREREREREDDDVLMHTDSTDGWKDSMGR